MDLTRRAVVAGLALGPVAARAADFRSLTPTPPMGWNSWDGFGPTINEVQARANAAVMATRLLPHGYNIFTVDIQWYEPHATSFVYRKGAALTMDGWGRLLPASNRFPSAAHGKGFAPLGDVVHRLGLKFGIHIMRGIPRQAVAANAPILGSPHRAADIADGVNVCPWNSDMYGVDMTKPGAQDYYDSLFRLYAGWGVDFIKADDMSRPYFRNAPEIAAFRKAIDRSSRPMILSLSPGETPLAAAGDVAVMANMWRISDDFWDRWPLLLEQFERLKQWSVLRRAGTWPDADMLPLGTLEMGRRKTHFTANERRTLLTLWSIARSPLIVGGDLTKFDDADFALLTNDEVLAVSQSSSDNREIFRDGEQVAWTARAGNGDVYLALFNLRDSKQQVTASSVPIDLGRLGLKGAAHVRDLWGRRAIEIAHQTFAPLVPRHGAGLYRLSAA